MELDSCEATLEKNINDEVKENQIQGVVVYANKLRHCAFIKRLDKKADRGYEAFNINIEKRSIENTRNNKIIKTNKNKEHKLTNKDALFRSTILAMFPETANSNKFEH
ncbi:unnamed protein product [Rotaria magnacalcarata]|uniref:Uncharacterized protein n=1 Tax=Rotaria magnacalcarata TaxID=392030 RepID=A0A814IC54_9BILA|nr:unnamed protein product [Rotaria magnacalcarata]CAF1273373.1 unnamed protein product [Rotaria magnacalcarata]CAF1928726.1 unnamed protein product [Rotaria magnacalcarata]